MPSQSSVKLKLKLNIPMNEHIYFLVNPSDATVLDEYFELNQWFIIGDKLGMLHPFVPIRRRLKIGIAEASPSMGVECNYAESAVGDQPVQMVNSTEAGRAVSHAEIFGSDALDAAKRQAEVYRQETLRWANAHEKADNDAKFFMNKANDLQRQLDRANQNLAATEKRLEREIVCHATCVAFAEGHMLDVDCKESPAMKAVRLLRKNHDVYKQDSFTLQSVRDVLRGMAVTLPPETISAVRWIRDQLNISENKIKSLIEELDRMKGSYEGACHQMAELFHTITGIPWGSGPCEGVLQDVKSVRKELEELRLHKENSPVANDFVGSLRHMAKKINANAVAKGFWEKERNDGEMMMLMVSELAEGFEYLRKNNGKSDHIPDFLGIEEEYADVVIRILDTCHARGYRLAEAVIAKMKFNESRPYKHNKTC
jgi:NTP pyrophosphatase (non-canonical NTP hydrolase)